LLSGSSLGGYRNDGFYGDNLAYYSTNNVSVVAAVNSSNVKSSVKRSSSTAAAAAHYVAASRLSLNEVRLYHQQQQQLQRKQQQRQLSRQLSKLSLHDNEFEASKFQGHLLGAGSNLLNRQGSRSHWDLPSSSSSPFGMDLDAPVFVDRRQQQGHLVRRPYQVSSGHLAGKLKSGLQVSSVFLEKFQLLRAGGLSTLQIFRIAAYMYGNTFMKWNF
jgi:hypothetical protein